MDEALPPWTFVTVPQAASSISSVAGTAAAGGTATLTATLTSPATSEAERIRLHQINPATGNRISLQPVDTETREELDRKDSLTALLMAAE